MGLYPLRCIGLVHHIWSGGSATPIFQLRAETYQERSIPKIRWMGHVGTRYLSRIFGPVRVGINTWRAFRPAFCAACQCF